MDLDIIRNGVTYSLSDGTYCRLISDDGTGMLPMHRLRERGPLQHGSTDMGYFYDPRTILLMLAVMDTSTANIDVKRKALQDIFAPQTNPLTLRYTLDGGEVREIECHYVDGLNLPHSCKDGHCASCRARLLAGEISYPTRELPAGITAEEAAERGGGSKTASPMRSRSRDSCTSAPAMSRSVRSMVPFARSSTAA
jgi:hypothetical protein